MFSKEKCSRILKAKSMMAGAIKVDFVVSEDSSQEVPLPPIDRIAKELFDNMGLQDLFVEKTSPEDANSIIDIVCFGYTQQKASLCWSYVIRIFVKNFGKFRSLDTKITYETHLARSGILKKRGLYKEPYSSTYFAKIL